MTKTYVVGDIHGGVKALKDLLEQVPYTAQDLFVFLGDYVDGWNDALDTLRFLMAFKAKQPAVFLWGNHDELLYNYLIKKQAPKLWLEHGGAVTKSSFDGLLKEEITPFIAFLESLDHYYIDQDNSLYVHAGFTNMHGPANEFYQHLVAWDRTLWELACATHTKANSDLFKPTRLDLFNEIYIGHTPVTRIGKTTPTRRRNVWNIDTGAAFKGPLTILEVQSKAFWQSQPVYSYYPNEKGRN